MNSYRLDHLSSHHVDDLDIQVAALEIRAQRRFQQERDLYRHSVGIATTKLQQYFLGLVLSHRGPNSAIHALVEEAATRSGLPVHLWAMHEVKQVWDEIVMLQRVYTQVGAPGGHQEYQDAPHAPVYSGAEHPKPNAGSAPQQHGGAGATRKSAVPRPPWAFDDDSEANAPLATKFGGAGKTMAQTGEDSGGLAPPQEKERIKYPSQEELQAEMRREQKAKEEAAAVQAAADKEEDARAEAEIERQVKEEAEEVERERAEARAKEEENKAKGVLDPVQQRELNDARDIFRGELSEDDEKILAKAKKEFGEDIMKWGVADTKKVLNRVLLGIHE